MVEINRYSEHTGITLSGRRKGTLAKGAGWGEAGARCRVSALRSLPPAAANRAFLKPPVLQPGA